MSSSSTTNITYDYQVALQQQLAITFSGEFCIQGLVEGRRNVIAPRRFYAATIEHKDPGFYPKSILIGDDIFTKALHTGITYELYGHIINHLYQYPPMMIVDYQATPPEPTTRLPRPTCSKNIAVIATGIIVRRFDREAYNDVILTVKHRDYDPGVAIVLILLQTLEWVDFFAEYICGHKYNDKFDPNSLQIGTTMRFEGHIKGFYESRNTWVFRVVSFRAESKNAGHGTDGTKGEQ
ncbi:uncharacterized protein MELLADRAFT_111870 [Melampsora larici-populina 98AG31]|uniref:Uncharacterized protein n=1 Tax=Melampsora larici-populina (strain 98AG31 / pathotype 3-4-7) TaxID=747676 RepID=F4S4M2_MELLP|nr:uncharacterized protein MELLADRAFT_111870 [Melampsora larici-populina 98AG31]EGG00439.1 hypothetical protein MELLADRAFT_111870 [Melampsora larici-populina 98AG31]